MCSRSCESSGELESLRAGKAGVAGGGVVDAAPSVAEVEAAGCVPVVGLMPNCPESQVWAAVFSAPLMSVTSLEFTVCFESAAVPAGVAVGAFAVAGCEDFSVIDSLATGVVAAGWELATARGGRGTFTEKFPWHGATASAFTPRDKRPRVGNR